MAPVHGGTDAPGGTWPGGTVVRAGLRVRPGRWHRARAESALRRGEPGTVRWGPAAGQGPLGLRRGGGARLAVTGSPGVAGGKKPVSDPDMTQFARDSSGSLMCCQRQVWTALPVMGVLHVPICRGIWESSET